MVEFGALSTWLRAWYEAGDSVAAGRFIEQFLQPAVGKVVRALGPDAEDAQQEVMVRFLDRKLQRGRPAETEGFWWKRIRWLAADYARTCRRLRARFVDLEAAEDAARVAARKSPRGDDTEGRVVEHLAARGEGWLKAQLAAMPETRRLFFLVGNHEGLRPFAVEADWVSIEARCGWGRARVEAFLDAAEGGDCRDLLPLLFGADEITLHREKCLDTFRKGRKRAYEDLVRALAESDL